MGEERPDQARQEFALSRQDFIRANNLFMVYLTDLDLVLLRVKAGDTAGDLLTETEFLLNKLKTIPAGQGFDDYALSVAGIIAMEAGQLDLARQRFTEVSQKCKQKGARQTLAGTRLLLARTHLLQGDEDTADSCLRKALSSAEADKWEYFWDWHAETIYSLCRRALSKKIHPGWAAYLLRRWFPRRTIRGRQSAGHGRRRARLRRRVLRDIAQERALIHINCLGGFAFL